MPPQLTGKLTAWLLRERYAMTKEKVIWTALPRGWNDDQLLRLSVFVSPRLSNADASATIRKLGEFPAFGNWPNRLAEIKFRVEFDSGDVVQGFPEAPADSELWSHLFPPDTPVRPYSFKDHATRNIHVFPTREIHQYLQQIYGELGGAGTDLPSIDDPSGPLTGFTPLQDIPNWITDSQSYYGELVRAQEKGKCTGRVVSENVADPGLPYAQQAAQNNFFQAYRFYSRPGSNRPDFPDDYVEPSPDVPEFDFHQMVAQIADHPEVLRRLGLVVDLVVDLPEPLAQLPAVGVVRVVPEGALPEFPPTTPGTRYDLDERWWGAKPLDDFRMWRGLLRLDPEFFELFQVDVDGAAMQVVGFANTLGRLRHPQRRGPDTPSEAAAPALRSAGLALARTNRGGQLFDDLLDQRDKNTLIEGGLPVVLHAEDLVRGYRVDIFDQAAEDGPSWFSLHQRVTTHEVKDPQGVSPNLELEITDEGYLKATSASSERVDHPSASDDLYLHETVFGWEGWSLSAPRPGKRIVEPGEGDDGSTIERYDPEADNPYSLVSRVAVAQGTLPRLRIGHTYRLRARTVDLAGNSRAFSREDLEPKEQHLASEAEKYLRFEPVTSPTVLRRHLDTEGESLEHLVVRSNFDTSASDYAVSPEVVDALNEAGVLHTYAEDAQRHLAPPKTSQVMAEQHSRFEDAFGGNLAQITAALRVALREEGTFLDENIIDLVTGQKTIPQTPIELFPPSTSLPANRGDGLPGGAYAYYPDESVLLPYLPDPLSIGVSLTGYDFTGVEMFHEVAKFPGEWPTLAPYRIRLSEGPLGVVFSDGILEVSLPKAEVIRARLSSIFPDNRLEDLGIWHWIPKKFKTEALKKAILQGRHWILTPFRWLTFTHAVQQPLMIPDMSQVSSTRSLGSTYAEFNGPLANHAKSTGRLDVFASWTEDVDLLTDDLPRMRALGTEVHHQAHAFGFDIEPGEDLAQVTRTSPSERESRHEFGDTKYRRILYHSVATTRFREFLPAPIANDLSRIQRVEPATDPEGNEFAHLVHHIPSSARPVAPDVQYVLPTFRWERNDDGNHRQHIRRGKAVRVWLSRPWFSSGDGEQLAIVLEPGVKLPPGWHRLAKHLELSVAELAIRPARVSLQPLLQEVEGVVEGVVDKDEMATRSASEEIIMRAEDVSIRGRSRLVETITAITQPPSPKEAHRMLRPYVTNWGSDPVWKSSKPEAPPTVAAFPRHVGYASGLTLEELPTSVKVVAAAHEVFFDPARKLWYCDIEIDPGDTYFPFVRLALARYQPHSVPNAHLSRVVMTDFIQLAPDRRTELTLSDGTAAVTVKGYAGRNIVQDTEGLIFQRIDFQTSDPGKPNTKVRAVLERRVPGIAGDLGWERVGNEITLNPSTAGYFVTWTGSLNLPDEAIGGGDYRILVTEVETHLRDLKPDDPGMSTTPYDFVRERVVFADIFEL
jgi:hypothetical protein